MKKSEALAGMVIVLLFVCGMVKPCWAGFKMKINDQTKGRPHPLRVCPSVSLQGDETR